MAQNNILARIQQLETMGLVNGQLEECYELAVAHGGNSLFAELLRMFCQSASTNMELMENILSDNVVDFGILEQICHDLQATVVSLGAVRVDSPCYDLREASHYGSASWCVSAIEEIRFEYLNLKAYLDEILQLL